MTRGTNEIHNIHCFGSFNCAAICLHYGH